MSEVTPEQMEARVELAQTSDELNVCIRHCATGCQGFKDVEDQLLTEMKEAGF